MKIINEINDELKNLRFNYFRTSKACNPENPRFNPEDTITNVCIHELINLVNARMSVLNCLSDISIKKAEAPSQFYSHIRNQWNLDVQFFFIDIDTTIGADMLFGDYQNELFKTFKNIVYMQKSWSGKIHVCTYVRVPCWSESKWREKCLYAAGMFNEWCSRVLNINYLDILDDNGKPVLDSHMFTLTQPLKFSDNDIIFNPYFKQDAACVGSPDSDKEVIKGTGLTYKDIISNYKTLFKQDYNNSTDVSSVLDYSKSINFVIGRAPKNQYTVGNNSRLCMVSALMAGKMSDDDILNILTERTISKKGGYDHNRQQTELQIRSCRTSFTNPNFKRWVEWGLKYLKNINVIYQAELNTDSIKPTEPSGESIHLEDDEYISQKHLSTWYDNVQNNKCVIVEAPTGTGKTEAAKRLADKMAKEDYISVIVTNTCALSGEYGKDKGITRVENMTTYMTEGNVYSMVFDKFVQYFSFVRKKKLFIIVDEVHTVTENMTFRDVCIELSDIMDDIKELDNIKLLMMSATPDYLTVNKFKDTAKQLSFTRTDTRKFQFKLVGNMDLKQAVIKAKKNDWADHICIFSDKGVGMDHTRALAGDDKPADFMWKGVSFDTGGDKYIGYYVSKHNDNWKAITMIDELVQTEKLSPHICMCTSAVFAGTNVKNEHEKFLILIDYSEFVSTADVRQILGRFRSNTNEYRVIILLNDSKWSDWRDFGGLEMYEADRLDMIPELDFIETTSELRTQNESNVAYSELLKLNSAYQHSNVNKLVFDYFMNEHMTKNQDGKWLMSYHKLLEALKLYNGEILLGSDFTSDADVIIKDDTLNIAKFIDSYFRENDYDIDRIKDNCQQRVYEKKEAAPAKKYVDTSINLLDDRPVDVSTWFSSSTAAKDISAFIKKPGFNFKNVFEDKIEHVKKFIEAYKGDQMYFKMAFSVMSSACPEVYDFLDVRREDVDFGALFDNFTDAECNSMIGIYSSADKTVRDIIYNDRIMAPIAETIIKIWRHRTERTAQSFIRHMRYTFGAYKISDSEYLTFTEQIMKNIEIYKARAEQTHDKFVVNSLMGEVSNEMRALEQMATGREMRGSSVDALGARVIGEYGIVNDKILEGNQKGGRLGGNNQKVEDKAKGGKTGGKKGKRCSVIAVYNDGHSVRLDADTRKEMLDKIKELCGGVVYGCTDGFITDWLADRNDKLFSCKPLGILRFEKCAPEGSLD